jgi:hypothetical protein
MTFDDPTALELTRAEALVLFDWLQNLEGTGDDVWRWAQPSGAHVAGQHERVLAAASPSLGAEDGALSQIAR